MLHYINPPRAQLMTFTSADRYGMVLDFETDSNKGKWQEKKIGEVLKSVEMQEGVTFTSSTLCNHYFYIS